MGTDEVRLTARLLLDANLSPLTGAFLASTFGLDVTDLFSEGLQHLRDGEIVEIAKRQQRVIVTFDLDFGEIYHRRERGNLGVIILRLENQTVEAVNDVLDRFFRGPSQNIALDRSLVVIDERRVRVSSEP